MVRRYGIIRYSIKAFMDFTSRGYIVHHRHGTIRLPSNGKSEQILNNRRLNGSFVARSWHDWEEKKWNKIQSTSAERKPKVSYMRPESTQTRQGNSVMRQYPRVEKKWCTQDTWVCRCPASCPAVGGVGWRPSPRSPPQHISDQPSPEQFSRLKGTVS